MKWVDIIKYDSSGPGEFKTVARALLLDDSATVTFEGDADAFQDLIEEGAENDGALTFPKDGERFLESLAPYLDNPQTLLATKVQEGEAPLPLG